jgi:hypothetical protein
MISVNHVEKYDVQKSSYVKNMLRLQNFAIYSQKVCYIWIVNYLPK